MVTLRAIARRANLVRKGTNSKKTIPAHFSFKKKKKNDI